MYFEKITEKQYKKDLGYEDINLVEDDLLEYIKEEYFDIPFPERKTKGSAGYDFALPFSIDLEPHETIKIPTGIRWVTEDFENDIVLIIYPRSGLGFKYQLGLANTVGVIDSDYFNSDSEGHIIIKLVNNGDKPMHLNKGDCFVQGIITPFLKTDGELDNYNERHGGMGSTDKDIKAEKAQQIK